MDHIKVLKRAWETTWRYRALWIFGIILAITTASAGSGGGRGSVDNFGPFNERPWQNQDFRWAPENFDWEGEDFDWDWDFDDWDWDGGTYTWPNIPRHIVNTVIAVIITVMIMVVTWAVVATIGHYVAQTALIQMVNYHEETGAKRSIRQGFRMGWSRSAFWLFLIKLVIILPLIAIVILLFALVAAPMLALGTGNVIASVIGTVTTIGLSFSLLFLLFVVGAALSVLFNFFFRACVLEGLGVMDSIREGYAIVRRNLKDVALMWLIMVGVRIGWAIALIIASIMLIPVVFILIAVGSVLGGLPALMVGGLISLFLEGTAPWIIGAVIGLPIFGLVVTAPWLFLGGLMETFKSSTWTLVYRELRALEGLEVEIEMEIEAGELLELDDVDEVDQVDEADLDSVPDSL